MGKPARRSGYTPRKTREQRAYRLLMVGGTSGAIAVVGILLAIFDVVGFGIPLLAALVAVACLLFFRRTVSG